jgi:hypothetical protein
VLRSSGLDEPRVAPPDKLNRQGRLYLRMEAQDLRLLRERSKARGMASATYAALALRSHLRGGAPLPKAEYVALMQAIEGLASVGRNLNQIARALNRGGRAELPGRQEVAGMLKIVEALRDHFRALLDANARSWEVSGAQATH